MTGLRPKISERGLLMLLGLSSSDPLSFSIILQVYLYGHVLHVHLVAEGRHHICLCVVVVLRLLQASHFPRSTQGLIIR
jgi:hypothetical protein